MGPHFTQKVSCPIEKFLTSSHCKIPFIQALSIALSQKHRSRQISDFTMLRGGVGRVPPLSVRKFLLTFLEKYRQLRPWGDTP